MQNYIEEIVVRYLLKEGYLVSRNIWFPVKHGKVMGWSDIDIFAVRYSQPPLVIQCKSFPGVKSSSVMAAKIIQWFADAVNFLKKSHYNIWLPEGRVTKIFVTNTTIKKLEEKLSKEHIVIWHFQDILICLLKKLKQEIATLPTGRIGKEDDILLRILREMIINEMILEEK